MLNYLKAHVLYPMTERYLNRDIRSKLIQLRIENNETPVHRELRKNRLLYETVSRAERYVPYYRDLFKSIGFSSKDLLKSPAAIHELPLLTKDILREQGRRMLSENLLPGQIHERQTNGSTGLVTTIWYDQDSLDWTAAVNLFASELSGRKQTMTEAFLSTRSATSNTRREARVQKIKCWALNRVYIETESFNAKDLDLMLSDLREAQPYSVQGHPSTIYFLAVHARKTEQSVFGLFRAFESTGESLSKTAVETIESVFGCKVFNRYGNAEFGVVAHSLDNLDEMTVIDSIVFPESHSLGNGLEEIVLTTLRNPAMPLIRYKTGDVGEVSMKNGRAVIRNLTGRVHDMVELNGQTYPTHFIKDILERVGGLDEFQILQKGASPIKTLKVVPNESLNKAALESRITELFGNSLAVEYISFDGLVLQGWRDKFRYLVKLD